MLSFFSRLPKTGGQLWEKFHYLSNSSLTKVEQDYYRGISRGHSVEIIQALLNNPREDFNYEAYEYACNKNDIYTDFNNLKKVLYLNEEPFDEDGSTLKYGEVSINDFPKYDNFEDLDDIADFKRTFDFVLSKRNYIFYKYGFDWVKAFLAQLNNKEDESSKLKILFKSEEELAENFVYLLESKFGLKSYLEIVKDEQDWMYA
jgi:hypothetical protein